MTYPFVGPVEVPTATAAEHPVRKEQLDTGLAGKSDTGHSHGGTYAAASHTHAGADINSGTVAVGRLPTGTSSSTVALGDHTHSGFAAASHVHSGADITSGTVPIAAIPTGTSGTTVALGNHNHDAAYAAASHNHAASAINSGTLDIARIPTGTTSTTVAAGNDTRLSVKPYPPVTLTDAGSVALDASLGTHFRLTPAGSRVIAVPTNPTDGQVIVIEHIVGGTARTLSLTTGAGGFKFGTDVTALTATAINTTDYIQACYHATANRWHVIGYIKGL